MTLGIGIIGFGFMGRTHAGSYRAAGEACRLVGLYDGNADQLRCDADGGGNIGTSGVSGEQLFDPDAVFTTDSLSALLARPDIDAVSVCTPTDTHVAIALEAMRAGKHVLVEKPVSLDRGDIELLAIEAERSGVVCMPAMCMRFWPAWVWLKARACTETLRSVGFERIGTEPGWGRGFYQDAARSGGALHDLHIHDTDFVCHLLGVPDAVTTVGDRSRMTTLYHYERGPAHAVASGGWLRGGADFRMRYIAEFDDATADFDLLREPPLKMSGVDSDEPAAVELSSGDGYDGEILAYLGAVASGGRPPVTLDDAAVTLRVLEAEQRSMETGRRVELPRG